MEIHASQDTKLAHKNAFNPQGTWRLQYLSTTETKQQAQSISTEKYIWSSNVRP